MEDQLKTKISEALGSLVNEVTDSVKSAKSFVGDNAQGFAKDFLTFKTIEIKLSMLFNLIFLILIPTALLLLANKLAIACTEYSSIFYITAGAISVVAVLITIGCTQAAITDLFEIKYSPRSYTLRYLANLIKEAKEQKVEKTP